MLSPVEAPFHMMRRYLTLQGVSCKEEWNGLNCRQGLREETSIT